jgi:predicted CoA-binding protein
MSKPTVAIIGASQKPERYSYLCTQGYSEHGYEAWPVHPSGQSVADHLCYKSIADLPGKAQIITLYVNPKIGLSMVDEISMHGPEWVWLNPGAESDELEQALRDKNLKVVRSCNLVALRLGDPLEIAQKITNT